MRNIHHINIESASSPWAVPLPTGSMIDWTVPSLAWLGLLFQHLNFLDKITSKFPGPQADLEHQSHRTRPATKSITRPPWLGLYTAFCILAVILAIPVYAVIYLVPALRLHAP